MFSKRIYRVGLPTFCSTYTLASLSRKYYAEYMEWMRCNETEMENTPKDNLFWLFVLFVQHTFAGVVQFSSFLLFHFREHHNFCEHSLMALSLCDTMSSIYSFF